MKVLEELRQRIKNIGASPVNKVDVVDSQRRAFMRGAGGISLITALGMMGTRKTVQAGQGAAYLVVATYNHQQYRSLSEAEQDEARDTARDVFGVGPEDYDGDPQPPMPAYNPLTTYFSFLAAFPYTPLPYDPDAAEATRASAAYGWVGLVPSIGQLDELMAALAGPFQQVFDIETMPVPAVKAQIAAYSISEEAWAKRGYRVYNEQTPAMWSH